MRSVREFIRAGVAGIHIEDQLYPKRAHYHKYVAHVTPRDEFVAKIEYACRQRAESDPDFVIIARSDACRFEGLPEAVDRINLAADVGADMGLVFPRNDEELRQAPQLAKIPLVYVMSRGNRDQRPLPTTADLEAMGYKACIDAVTSLGDEGLEDRAGSGGHYIRTWLAGFAAAGRPLAWTSYEPVPEWITGMGIGTTFEVD